MSYGSKAFGHPFQPSSVTTRVRRARPRLPRVQKIGMRPVGAAVEDADGRAFAGEALVPGVSELVRLRVEDAELLQAVEVAAPRSGRGRVGHFLLPQVVHGRLQRGLRRCLVQVGLGDPERRSCLLQLNELHRDNPRQPGQLRRRGDAERADHQRDVARIRVPAVAQERGGVGGSVALRRCVDEDALRGTLLDEGAEPLVELCAGRVGLRLDRLRGFPKIFRRRRAPPRRRPGATTRGRLQAQHVQETDGGACAGSPFPVSLSPDENRKFPAGINPFSPPLVKPSGLAGVLRLGHGAVIQRFE